MKVKFLTVAAMSALLLNSCSEDIVTSESAQTPVGFRIAGTRATTLYSTASLPAKLTVDAYLTTTKAKFFEKIDFNKLTAEEAGVPANNYLSTDRYYWPAGENNGLSFFAVAGIAAANNPTVASDINAKKLSVTDFVNGDGVDATQEDLLGAFCEGTKTENAAAGVSMKLHHLLSLVEVKAKSDNPSYDFKITECKLVKIVKKGDLEATWTASNVAPTCVWKANTDKANKTQVTVNVNNEVLTSTATSLTDKLICMPQTLTAWTNTGTNKVTIANNEALTNPNSYIAIKAEITTKAGAAFYTGYCNIPLSGTWEAGKKYTYILDFTNGAGYDENGDPIFGKPINFKCEVSTWTDGTATNPNMNVN